MATTNGHLSEQLEMDTTDFEHTGPGTLAGRYLRRFWQPVHIAQDLLPDRALPVRIMNEEFTLYRGETGIPHLVAFRCAHRGTQLSTGWIEDDCIRCRYHGWKYDGSGQCVEQPMEDASFASKVKIASYPVQEYLGLIFAYLGEGEAPPLPRYAQFEADGVLEWEFYTRACNYFNMMENDPGHGAFVHRDPRLPKGVFEVVKVTVDECPFGVASYTKHQGHDDAQATLHGMPNIRYLKNPPRDPATGWIDAIMWKVPIDDENHMNLKVYRVNLSGEAAEKYLARRKAWRERGGRDFAPEITEEILAGRLRLDDVEDRKDVHITKVQDDVTQMGQGRIRDKTQDRLGPEDNYVILLRKIWQRELRALAEGLPLTRWTLPEGLVPTEGHDKARPARTVVYDI